MRVQTKSLLAILPALAAAVTPPSYDGYSIIFSDDFAGAAGSSPSSSSWNVALSINTNNEAQTYTTSNTNLQISGGQTVQFIPRKSASGIWTSSRIETKGSYTPTDGKIMLIQASIYLGGAAQANKQGLWPAFWALGDSIRHGTQWPAAGEIDIFEQVDGIATAYGTVHCGSTAGGPCNEPSGLGTPVAMPTDGFNTYAVRIDRTNSDWTQQTIKWELNGAVFKTLTGADINDSGVWSTLAHSPYYILLNVAVGGEWPGQPNDATTDGYDSMMEVSYVAVYST